MCTFVYPTQAPSVGARSIWSSQMLRVGSNEAQVVLDAFRVHTNISKPFLGLFRTTILAAKMLRFSSSSNICKCSGNVCSLAPSVSFAHRACPSVFMVLPLVCGIMAADPSDNIDAASASASSRAGSRRRRGYWERSP